MDDETVTAQSEEKLLVSVLYSIPVVCCSFLSSVVKSLPRCIHAFACDCATLPPVGVDAKLMTAPDECVTTADPPQFKCTVSKVTDRNVNFYCICHPWMHHDDLYIALTSHHTVTFFGWRFKLSVLHNELGNVSGCCNEPTQLKMPDSICHIAPPSAW